MQNFINEKIEKYNLLTKNKIDTAAFKKYLTAKKILVNELNNLDIQLHKYETNQMGFVIAETKEFLETKKLFDIQFKKYQQFNLTNKMLNSYYNKHFRFILIENLDISKIN
jgi:flagellar biosynthesis/type III secretory pathway chaperone